jgi:hypothetical protein
MNMSHAPRAMPSGVPPALTVSTGASGYVKYGLSALWRAGYLPSSMLGSGIVRRAGTKTFSATTVLLPVADMPVAYQSSRIFRSALFAIMHVGISPTSTLSTVHVAPWQPVLNGQRPLTTKPPSSAPQFRWGEHTGDAWVTVRVDFFLRLVWKTPTIHDIAL